MKKKALFIGVLAILSVLFIGCKTEEEIIEDKRDKGILAEVESLDISWEESDEKGFDVLGETKRANYYFIEDSPTKTHEIESIENIMTALEESFSVDLSEEKYSIYFTREDMENKATLTKKVEEHTIYIEDDIYSIGAVADVLIGHGLPNYLLAGLEMAILDEGKEISPKDALAFTQENQLSSYFVKGLQEDKQKTEEAFDISAAFINSLGEASFNELAELIKLYIEDADQGHREAEAYWKDFLGDEKAELDIAFRHPYRKTDFYFINAGDSYTYKVDKGYRGIMKYADMTLYEEALREATERVEDFYSEEISGPVDIYLYPQPPKDVLISGQAFDGEKIDIFVQLPEDEEFFLTLITHELMHILDDQKGYEQKEFYPLEEGIATVVSNFYEKTEEGYVFNFEESEYHKRSVAQIRGREYHVSSATEKEAILAVEPDAMTYTTFFDVLEGDTDNFTKGVNSYEKASSFTQYLLETYGQDTFLESYTSEDGAYEEVYGRTLNELIIDWEMHILGMK